MKIMKSVYLTDGVAMDDCGRGFECERYDSGQPLIDYSSQSLQHIRD